MFGFGRPSRGQTALFRIENSSLFQKNELSPIEFGGEITKLGIQFSMGQFEDYVSREKSTDVEVEFMKKVQINPGFLQLVIANLITASFHCYARVLLHAKSEVIKEMEEGIAMGLRSAMPRLDEDLIEHHRNIVIGFSTAIEREIENIEEESSVSLLVRYVSHFYLSDKANETHKIYGGLSEQISGLGSKFMGICQNNFQLQLITK